MKITELTDAQKAKFPEYVDKWIKIGLCTEPANREKSEVAIKNLYALAKLKEPKVIWLPCPISAAIASVVYAKIINKKIAVYSAINSAVDSAVGSAVNSAINSAVNSAVNSAINSAVGSAVGSAVRSAVGSAVYSAINSAVDSAVDSAVYSAINSAVNSAVDSAVYSAVDSAVYSAINSAVNSAVYSAVRSAVRSAVDSAVYSAINSAVDSAVGSAVNSAVNSAVYSAVRSAVRSAVDSAVGSAINSAVDSAVDSAVGSAVNSAINSAVGSAVGSAGMSYFGGSLWCGYQSWADYFNKELSIPIDRNYLDLAENCGYYWTLDSVCFASERPNLIKLDDIGRLHNEFGMSISYPSGWGLFHWHGVSIPREWIENKQSLTAKMAITWTNIEQRRAACELVGWDKILNELTARTIDHDPDPEHGTLYEVDLPDSPKEKFLRVKCATGRTFALRIDPKAKTVLEAQCWVKYRHFDTSKFNYPEITA